MSEDQEPTLLACSLEQAELADRQRRWLQLARRALVDVLTTESGLQLAFSERAGVDIELRQLAELERKCCAFANWDVLHEGDQLVLDVRAPSEGGVAAVQAMFRQLRSAQGARPS
jgi:hypothetical protein